MARTGRYPARRGEDDVLDSAPWLPRRDHFSTRRLKSYRVRTIRHRPPQNAAPSRNGTTFDGGYAHGTRNEDRTRSSRRRPAAPAGDSWRLAGARAPGRAAHGPRLRLSPGVVLRGAGREDLAADREVLRAVRRPGRRSAGDARRAGSRGAHEERGLLRDSPWTGDHDRRFAGRGGQPHGAAEARSGRGGRGPLAGGDPHP